MDETLGEMFLEEKTPNEDDIRVGHDRELCLKSQSTILYWSLWLYFHVLMAYLWSLMDLVLSFLRISG